MILERSELDDSQLYIIKMIRKWRAILIAMAMGGGKTAAVLTVIIDLLDAGEVRRVLIVAPPRVASDTWPDEIAKWRHTRDLDFVVLDGSPIERQWELGEDADVTIVSRENFVWLFKWVMRRIGRWPFDMIVWDESSSLRSFALRKIQKAKVLSTPSESAPVKSAASKKKEKQWTRFGALAVVQKDVKYMVELSGTPHSNGLLDLGGQIFILDGGERLGRNKTAFEKRWFETDYMGWNIAPREFAEREIMDRLRDIMVYIPPRPFENDTPVFIDVPVRLPARMMKEYRQFKRTLVSESYDVEAVSQGVLTGKLLQFANGAMYQEKKLVEKLDEKLDEWVMSWERSVVPVHTYKLDALESVIEEAAGNPLLIAYSFEFDKAAIKKRFPKVRLIANEKNGVRDWNAGKIELGLVHPAAIGHGTNLQFGGHLLCWYGLTWSKELYDQLNMRLPRRGQEYEVLIYRIIAEGTIDESVVRKMHEKGMTQARLNDAVRVSLREMERELAA